jgi:hypothetical protein
MRGQEGPWSVPLWAPLGVFLLADILMLGNLAAPCLEVSLVYAASHARHSPCVIFAPGMAIKGFPWLRGMGKGLARYISSPVMLSKSFLDGVSSRYIVSKATEAIAIARRPHVALCGVHFLAIGPCVSEVSNLLPCGAGPTPCETLGHARLLCEGLWDRAQTCGRSGLRCAKPRA